MSSSFAPLGLLLLHSSPRRESLSFDFTTNYFQNRSFLKSPINRCGAAHRKSVWLFGSMRREREKESWRTQVSDDAFMFGSDEEFGSQVPTQAQSIVEGSGTVLVSENKPIPDLEFLQELLAIQQQGPRVIGFFGTRNMGFMHQQLIEILSYAMVITKNHIFTSGASGTNAAVIRGGLRAENPELLTVILPQSPENATA